MIYDIIEVTSFKMSIKDNLNDVMDRISDAAYRCGRDIDEIDIVAVTKNVDAYTIIESVDLGINHIGENRAQEFKEKYDIIKKPVKWHFIGTLQTNKVKYVIDKVDLIHSLDRLSLAKELDKRGKRIDRVIPVLVQINISKESTKSGIHEEDLFKFMDTIAGFEFIKVKGFMTIAPNTSDSKEVGSCFSRLRRLSDSVKKQGYENTEIQYLSMGMTNDFEIAIQEGANMLRIGRAIFGDRI